MMQKWLQENPRVAFPEIEIPQLEKILFSLRRYWKDFKAVINFLSNFFIYFINKMTENTYLEIKTSTWHRDTNGLYDYQASITAKNHFTINYSAVLHRANNSCILNSSSWNRKLSEDSNPILSIKARGGEFIIQQSGNELNERLWLVIKSIRNNGVRGYKICEGDWIRLGRVKLQVKKICTDTTKKALENESVIVADGENPKFQYFEPLRGDSNEVMACRICLNNENSTENPLISPCYCTGTMKHIHISCLQEWLKNKAVVISKFQKVTSFFWNELSCEICKAPFPLSIYIKGVRFDLIKIENPGRPYVLLEDYSPERHEIRCLRIVSLNNGESASLGRGNKISLKIPDVSVSRRHCKLKFIENNFILEDTNSKFGTLVLMKKSFVLQPHTEVTVQIGRTIVHLLSKEPFSYKSCLWAFGIKKVMPITYCSYLTQADIIEDNPAAFGSSRDKTLLDFEPDLAISQHEFSIAREEEKSSSNENINQLI
ncbi:unnamed protein product [Blepharisma stoltei]|uniref:Uncharacterized protein n=1 Tax=Blepharisma stoltei TaxID=1481888 RepID=A0AAU9K6T4_9CILI|nr:unnamed protein product [Blepharisma stoltei]